MFTVDELLSKRNQKEAFDYLSTKKDSAGCDGIKLSELQEYWTLNGERICREIREGNYYPGTIELFDILKPSGKKRTLSRLNSIDRFITRLLEQKLTRYIEPLFLENSFAYQEGKGVLAAVTKAKEFILQGNNYVIEVDMKDYFDNIPLVGVENLMWDKLKDPALQTLISRYLRCKISFDGVIKVKDKGLVQGCPISPILSNLYLQEMDVYMQEQKLNWMRYADNIYIYEKDNQKAMEIYRDICDKLIRDFELGINKKRSGVFDVFSKKVLGYQFIKKQNDIEIRRVLFQQLDVFDNWNSCKIQKVNQEYHIVKEGILTKKDYALLFENEEKKYHIPVEIVDQINFYSNVIISSQVLSVLSAKNIKVSFFDKYGNLEGYYMPEKTRGDAKLLIKQCELYGSEKRVSVAKKMEKAALHNMRANLRYYNKRKDMSDYIMYLDKCLYEINTCVNVDALLLVEARARAKYYEAFNSIISNKDFRFVCRSKQPPKDELNALISFGNTLLYNLFLQAIWKTALDPRIGVVHATNRRNHTLNLDFADIYKPIIVDRVIFTLINCNQLKKIEHFQYQENGGVYLSKEGKRVFLEEFERKMSSQMVIKGKVYSYKSLITKEVANFMKMVSQNEKYSPYKYY